MIGKIIAIEQPSDYCREQAKEGIRAAFDEYKYNCEQLRIDFRDKAVKQMERYRENLDRYIEILEKRSELLTQYLKQNGLNDD